MNNQSKNKKPPKFAEYLMSRMFPDDSYYTTISDLEEDYKYLLSKKGKVYAGIWYRLQMFPALVCFLTVNIKWGFIMLKNYIKIAFRNIKNNKLISFINLTGFSIGITVSVLLIILVHYELSYDSHHVKAENIYRVCDRSCARTQAGLAAALKEDNPAVISAGRLFFLEMFLKFDDRFINNTPIYFADPEILDILEFSSVIGNLREIIKKPNSLILSESAAQKYFGDNNPIGKTVMLSNRVSLTIMGIMTDIPGNTHFTMDFLTSMPALMVFTGEQFLNEWGSREFFTYIRLNDKTNPAEMKTYFENLKKKHGLHRPEYFLQPVTKIHLSGNLQAELENNSDIKLIYIMISLVVFLVIIICLNYINLSTIMSFKRMKEIGLRKTLGSNSRKIAAQFFTESALQVSIAVVISIVLSYLFLPHFNAFFSTNLSLNIIQEPIILLLYAGVFVLVTLLSGTFPSLYLAYRQPALVVRGKLQKSTNHLFRNILITIQFVLTIILVVCTTIIFRQLNFLRTNSSSLYGETTLIVQISDNDIRNNYMPIISEIKKHADVIDVTASYNLSYRITSGSWLSWQGQDESEKFVIRQTGVLPNFLDFFKMDIIEGNSFSKKININNSNDVIINQTAARMINDDDLIGKKVSCGIINDGIITGIVKDFHFKPLHQKIEPLILTLIRGEGRYRGVNFLSIKIRPGNYSETITFLADTWKNFSKDYPFNYFFLDDNIDAMYRQELKYSDSAGYLTLIVIILACFGLYGFSMFLASMRTKEIGIRKVLGASNCKIFLMLACNVIKLLFVSSIIAVPVSWFVINRWLDNYEYSIEIKFLQLIIPVILLAGLVLFTISYQFIKVSLSNPVDALKCE